MLVHARNLPPPPTTTDPFVRPQGTQFVLNGRPFYFVGANAHVMHGRVARTRMPETLRTAARDGLRVIRIWALGEGHSDDNPWLARDYYFRTGPDGWQAQAYHHLDHVLETAANLGLKVIITLSNRWKDYGGIPTYLRWAKQTDLGDYGYSDLFFTHSQVKSWYLEHVLRIVNRRNQRTGTLYRDDPTIFAWELQNEMGGTPEAASARRDWVRDIARAIRQTDQNHMIVPGLIGYKLQEERKNWLAMNGQNEVSFCDQHIYPAGNRRIQTPETLRQHIDDRVQLAHYVLKKPIIFGEFGFPDRKSSQQQRARQHRILLDRLFYNGGNGALVWIYQPDLGWKRMYGVLTDKPAYQPLRNTFRSIARRLSRDSPDNRNPKLGPHTGSTPLEATHAEVSGTQEIWQQWTRDDGNGSAELRIPVDGFHRSWFEEAGTWDRGILVHTYGRNTGWIDYRFRVRQTDLTGFQTPQLTLRIRVSSEYPGLRAPADGTSSLSIHLDGKPAATITASPDDGMGTWHQLLVPLPVPLVGTHILRIAVPRGTNAHGVSIYGRESETNREPVDEPGPITLTLRDTSSAASKKDK